MLVLTRKTAETIQIGEGVVVKVISCGRGRVKIGIDAPSNVRVVRGELLEEALVKRSKPAGSELMPHVAAPVA